jgi:hypothetical protein
MKGITCFVTKMMMMMKGRKEIEKKKGALAQFTPRRIGVDT